MKRILMLIARYPPHLGGAERQAQELAQGLATQGWDVTVLTQTIPGVRPGTLKSSGVTVTRVGFPVSSWVGSLSYLAAGAWTLWHQKPFDVYHAHLMSSPALLGALFSAFRHRPLVVKIGASGRYGDIEVSRGQWLGAFKRWILRKTARGWIATSSDIIQELIRMGVSIQRIVQIPNGVNEQLFAPLALEGGALAVSKLSLPEGIGILFSGRWVPQKRPELLLNVFPSVQKRFPDIFLVFLGEGPLEKDLREIARPFTRVYFRSTHDQMVDFLRACKLFVLPSDSEGLSNSLLEAMSSGLLCVVSDIEGNRSLIQDGVNGFLFRAGDPYSLESALVRALRAWPAKDQRTQVRRFVLAHCRMTDVVMRYIEFYGRLMDEGEGVTHR